MIIDLILDRRANEKDIARGLTHYRTYPNPSGKKFGQIELNDDSILVPFAYNAKDFYNELQYYGEIFGDLAWNITRAMDEGNEEDVKRELCNYVITQGYSEDEFQSSLESYYDGINIEDCEEYIGELECSLSLMYEWDIFHNEYRIIEVENGLI